MSKNVLTGHTEQSAIGNSSLSHQTHKYEILSILKLASVNKHVFDSYLLGENENKFPRDEKKEKKKAKNPKL